jgi:dihydropteroate synthase
MAFDPITTLQIRGRIIDLSTPLVMGIINLTDDSFYTESRKEDLQAALNQAELMISQGADIIDLGAASSRPGSVPPSQDQEIETLVPVIKALRSVYSEMPISVDTYRSAVAFAAINAGADIINDISAGTFDSEMLSTAAKCNVAIVLMHMQGEPGTMQNNPQYADVVTEVCGYLSERIKASRAIGIKDIIVDPGFGFGKSDAHNFRLLKELAHFQLLGVPVLVGLSRKSMIQRTLDVSAEDALDGTTALHMAALMNGASILRVHDVKEAVACVKLFNAMQS